MKPFCSSSRYLSALVATIGFCGVVLMKTNSRLFQPISNSLYTVQQTATAIQCMHLIYIFTLLLGNPNFKSHIS